ncbi:MAG: InlB B-repeat-containing protein [Clostridia bacterium]|nr:InlB B-repeat-containing protein [Clostridia bacterium]
MKKLLNKGKVIVSCISVLAILAVSLLSMFTGVTFIASAEGEATEGETTVTYPLNGSYDADMVVTDEADYTYSDIDTSKKTEVSEFTDVDSKFWLTAKGKGTAADPFIVETANQFAAVVNGLEYDSSIETKLDISKFKIGSDNILDTEGVCFKIADNVKAFNMSNTESTVDFSGDMTAAEVEAALADAKVKSGLGWTAAVRFKGRFDGNGAVIYGLKAKSNSNMGGLFPEVEGDITIRNLTVKNCYFTGDSAAVFIGINRKSNPKTIFENCAAYNNVVVATRLNNALTYGGILEAASSGDNIIYIDSCLVYGNIAKHSDYDIQYGLWTRGHSVRGSVISNSIVLDCTPYSQVHSYNGFYTTAYSNIYTNFTDETLVNEDWTGNASGSYKSGTPVKYKNTAKINDQGSFTELTFDKATGDAASDGVNYSRTLDVGAITAIAADDIKGAAAKDAMSGLDWEKWTVNENGYPTPKVYSVREYSAGEAWSGELAWTYSSGTGTKDSPYVVSTTEELALMLTTESKGKYYALGADIIINADLASNAKQWFTSNDVPAFEGSLDGKGYTVSGIYYDGTQAGEHIGLIPVLGSNAAVKNLVIADSVINGRKGAMGAVAGATEDMCAQVIKTTAVVVEDTVKFEGNATKGGIIGKIGYSAVKIEDCLSKSAGFYGEVTGQANIKRSISVGAYPFASANNVKVENVYTDTEGLEVEGVTVVSNADMLGAAAETSMAGLGFPTSWKTVDGSYPAPTGAEASANGVKGEAWTGAIASAYAGGIGTEADPYLIETAEQLARFVTNIKPGTKGNLTYYKLTADIYLNDVESNLWKDKVGCIEWYTQRTTNKGSTSYTWFSLDGDGHVIYGMYLNEIGDEYYRAGLVPYLSTGATIENIGISEAYLMGNPQQTDNDCIGAIAGVVPGSVFDDAGYPGAYIDPKYTHDSTAVRAVQWDAEFNLYRPDIRNCFVDHTCYIAGRYAGGLVGNAGGPVYIENCAVTATIVGGSAAAGLVGTDSSGFSTYTDSVSLPQNCVRAAEGSANNDWRDNSAYWVTEVYQVYYFATKRLMNTYFIKLSNPLDRVGTAARNIMTGLDWDDNSEDGTNDYWRVVEDGTPVLTVFAKHRTDEELEKFSDKNFSPPEVTVSLSTGTDEVELDPLVGRMYSKITLPTIERDGYEFTGWYAFSDCSVEYPVDYFPPRSLTLYAGWEPKGIIQNFESYTETIWDNDSNCWTLNKPGAKGGYKNAYVRNGSKSMHLLGTNTEPADCLLNYEEMLKPGAAYTITFWVTTDTENNPATLLSLVHNSKPDYLNSAVAVENMAVATGLTAGEWVQYSYSFTAQTKWISIRATAGSSLYFDDIMIAELDGTLEGGKVVNLGTGSAAGGTLSPNTGDVVSVAVLISAVMACAVIAVISRKNLVEIVEE